MNDQPAIQDYSIVPEAAKRPLWFNGRLIDWHRATLHATTHATNYGSGVFEGIRFYETERGPAIFRVDAHLERLARSMGLFNLKTEFSSVDFKQGCIDVAKASEASSGYLRPQVQFGLSRLALGAVDVVDALILFRPLEESREKEGLSVVTSEVRRISPNAVAIEAKVTGYYTNSYFNQQYSKEKGADKAVMLDLNGNVAEGSSVNVFHVKNGELFTPAPGFILKGITRSTVLGLAEKELQIPVHETTVTPDDLRSADEIFFTGTAAEIEPVIEYDGNPVGHGGIGSVTEAVRGLYQRATQGTLPDHDFWLTYVD